MNDYMILEDWEDSNSNLSSLTEFETSQTYVELTEHGQDIPKETNEVVGSEPDQIILKNSGECLIPTTKNEISASEDINTTPAETQRFIIHFNENKITLTSDPVSPSSKTNDNTSSTNVVPTAEICSKSIEQSDILIRKKQSDKSVIKRMKVERKKPVGQRGRKKKSKTENTTNVPSVYSYSEIKRHKKRLTLKALQDDSSSDSDSKSNDDDLDPNLDVNLRIFEANSDSVENVIIGEIHCDVVDDKKDFESNTEKQNKNSSIFKLSVNTALPENQPEEDKKKQENSDVEEINTLYSLSDDDFFSDDDSDLEILTSKSIVRKRALLPSLKKERAADSDKITMYDLICDTVQPEPRPKIDSNVTKLNSDSKKKESKKPKPPLLHKDEEKNNVKTETSKESESTNDNKIIDALPVPQLKVNADGQVIIDMDSLMIEQTGVAEARAAIAHSEVVEESGLNFKSYSRKTNRRQWSPHDTLKFYDVLSVVGTDFTLMATLFPGRTRNCIKRKFKKEEKTNSDLILKALTCKQKFNIGLLEKELKLKEEKVNLLRKNSKKVKRIKQKSAKSRQIKTDKSKKEKSEKSSKRKSFFERGISCFQNS